ncbi:MAG TPA: hypothetical protein VF233_02120, partial [Nitrososphaeraceae archaeon]
MSDKIELTNYIASAVQLRIFLQKSILLLCISITNQNYNSVIFFFASFFLSFCMEGILHQKLLILSTLC